MDIVYSIDEHFIPQAAALTASILEQGKTSGAEDSAGRFCFHILSNGILQESRECFAGFARSRGAEARFYDLGDFEQRLEKILGKKPETGRYVKAALGRIFAPQYLPADVHRFVYLDADMIAGHDIRGLWETELCGCILAAAAEPTIYAGLTVEQTVPGIPGSPEGRPREAYFNTGVLVVDRDAWDREQITEQCLDWYAEHNGTFDFADQDILNHVLAGRIRPLSQRWNFQTNYHYRTYKSLTASAPWYGKLISAGDYEASAGDPVLVHFAGDERPWIHGNRNPYRELYKRALASTDWKDTPEVRGKEAYMAFYHLVNLLSAKIPGFRDLVSKTYYRTRMKKNGKKFRTEQVRAEESD